MQELQAQVKESTTQVRELTGKVVKRENIIEMLLQNGKTKDKQIEALMKSIENLREAL